MGYDFASKDLLTQAYASPPAPLGQALNYKGGRYVCFLSKDTIAAGKCIAFKAAIDPALAQVTLHDHTSTTTAGLAVGFAMAASTTGQYFFGLVGGIPDSSVPNLLSDGSVAAGLPIIPSATTDGTVIAGTAAGDANRLAIAVNDDSGTVVAAGGYIMINRFGL